jgi:hypothetical protein
MPRIWYRGGPVATAILVVAPIGNTTVLLLLSLTVELALALMLVRERRPAAPAEISSPTENPAPVYLLRRMVPRLRARRPFGIVQEQVRWRVRAEAHRRRGFALRLAGDPPRDRQP